MQAERPSENDFGPGMKEAMDAVSIAATMPPETARNYLEMLGCVAIHFMRAKFGDEYARGWVEHALSDFDRPPLLTLRKPQ